MQKFIELYTDSDLHGSLGGPIIHYSFWIAKNSNEFIPNLQDEPPRHTQNTNTNTPLNHHPSKLLGDSFTFLPWVFVSSSRHTKSSEASSTSACATLLFFSIQVTRSSKFSMCLLVFFLKETLGPIGSMGLVYLPTFTVP